MSSWNKVTSSLRKNKKWSIAIVVIWLPGLIRDACLLWSWSWFRPMTFTRFRWEYVVFLRKAVLSCFFMWRPKSPCVGKSSLLHVGIQGRLRAGMMRDRGVLVRVASGGRVSANGIFQTSGFLPYQKSGFYPILGYVISVTIRYRVFDTHYRKTRYRVQPDIGFFHT